MVNQPEVTFSAEIGLPSPEATERLAQAVASVLGPGDVILIDGPIGAGKSHFCRAAIHALLRREGRDEDVPSPTFTIVQTYDLDRAEIWHTDLYRLAGPDQAVELGLEDAFETAIVFVEWPDRLGDALPKNALRISLASVDDGEARIARFAATDPRWRGVAERLASFAGTGADA